MKLINNQQLSSSIGVAELSRRLYSPESPPIQIGVSTAETRNLADVINIKEAIQLLQSGPLKLPGGGTVTMKEDGDIEIIGEQQNDGQRKLNLIELEKFFDGTRGLINLRGLNNCIARTNIQHVAEVRILRSQGKNARKQIGRMEELYDLNNLPTHFKEGLLFVSANFYDSSRGLFEATGLILLINSTDGFSIVSMKDREVGFHYSIYNRSFCGSVTISDRK